MLLKKNKEFLFKRSIHLLLISVRYSFENENEFSKVTKLEIFYFVLLANVEIIVNLDRFISLTIVHLFPGPSLVILD